MTNATRRLVLAAAALGLLVGASGRAEAEIIITIEEDGQGNVVTTGSGSLDLTGLTFDTGFGATPQIKANTALVAVGPRGASGTDGYTGAMGPSSFGPGSRFHSPSSGSGDFVGISSGEIFVPFNYASGTMLSATDTYSGQTFSSLGLTPGTYTYHWGTGGPDHTLTVQIGTAAVPEPSSLALALTGGALALGYARRRHRRAKVMA